MDFETFSYIATVSQSTPITGLFFVVMVVYVIAAISYFVALGSSNSKPTKIATSLLLFAFLLQSVEISLRAMESVHPGSSVREALGFFSWLLVFGYLLAAIKNRLILIGAFIAPVALALYAVARLTPTGKMAEGLTLLGRIHIALATVGVAVFALAAGVALVFMWEERSLKSKNFDGVFFRRGIALETLEQLLYRFVLIGFPIFSLSLLLGVIWVSQRGSGFDRPEYPLAILTWISFTTIIIARNVLGWPGRRLARLTLLGFSTSILVFSIYLLRRVLG